jgi:TonB family protein
VSFKPLTEEDLLKSESATMRGIAEMQNEPGFFASLAANLKSVFAPADNTPLQISSRPLTKEELAQTSYGEMDATERPFYISIAHNLQDLLFPKKLPPLEVTSKPVQVRELFGQNEYKGRSQAVSMAIHIGVVALAFGIGTSPAVQKAVKNSVTVFTPTDLDPFVPQMQVKKQAMGGGGGGGDRSPLPASKGRLPRADLKQFTPPMAVVNNPNPRLIMEPTIIAPPDMNLPQVNLSQYGDPMAKIGPPSNGPGSGGGIGSGSGGGVGSGRGGGFGPGEGGGAGGGAFRIGGGVSPPVVIFKKEPEYSEEARKAKYQGTVLLAIVVDVDGTTRNIRVLRPLGMGLDEKAIEAVRQWKFKPGYKNGEAVPVMANVEVNFRLL